MLQAIPGVTLVEMALSHEDALCCGGGGSLEMVDSALVKDIGQRKLQLALDTGAPMIVSACQQCKRTICQGIFAPGEPCRSNRIQMGLSQR